MPNFPEALAFMVAIAPAFTKPAFALSLRLIAGWVLCPARRTITGIFPFADPKRDHCVQAYHYFFRTAAWAQSRLFRHWAIFLVNRLCVNDKTLLLAVDDTPHKKTGRKVNGARTCRDAVRSTKSRVVYCWALQFVPVCLVVQPPWGGEPLAIPVNIRLNRKNQNGATLLTHTKDMLQELAQWLPDRDFRLVGDGAFASLADEPLVRTRLISRLRSDAAIFDLPAPRQPGQRGRARLKGARLPKPSELAKTISDHAWTRVKTRERGEIRERLLYTRQVIWVGVSKEPILLIISRDPEGKEADDFFFSTDVTIDAALAVGDFADRWSVEDTFRSVKQHLGAEQPQSWKGIGPERAGAFSYMVYGAVWLARMEREGQETAFLEREWYGEKACVSFLDALADLRQRLWDEKINAMSSSRADHAIIQRLLVRALAWAS